MDEQSRKDKESLKAEAKKMARDAKNEFHEFISGIKIQVELNRIQFFQYLSTTVLAVSGLLISLKIIDSNIWIISGLYVALFILIYSTSYCREYLDIRLTKMRESQISLEDEMSNLMRSVELENFKQLREQTQVPKTVFHYDLSVGQVMISLFFLLLSLMTIGLLKQTFSLEIATIILILCLPQILSRSNWATKFTKIISRYT